jgi:hydrogenase maturation protein HypF
MADVAKQILLRGAVQGCGLRPALARWARERRWHGSVRNTGAGVELVLRGDLPADDELVAAMASAIQPIGVVDEIEFRPFPGRVAEGFQIVASATEDRPTVPWPLDRAICAACLAETRDPNNRRYAYPFASCAQCGPRYTILRALPFDRERTTMNVFALCARCETEYQDEGDRRAHAQTISCPDCGPQLWSSDGEKNSTAIAAAAERLRAGQIVALRGVGGDQLLAVATSDDAVNRLRSRKRRPEKPLAVMCRSLDEARQLAELNNVEEEELASPANPIVLVRQRRPSFLSAGIHPNLRDIGLMLPTTALHDLLVRLVGRPLLCTSGNVEGEPLAYQIDEAEERLRGVADFFLHHDREILRPIDDSVVRVMAGRAVTIRAGRGIAPVPLSLPSAWRSERRRRRFLACGGQQKGALAVADEDQAFLLPHLGDLETVASQERWGNAAEEQWQGTGVRNATIVVDPHPGYFATQWGSERAASPRKVWHHHAHVVAAMLEHGWLDREVLGIAWDGTGLGPDGTIWGGDILRARAARFERVAHFRPFALPGGEAAIRDVRRTLVSVLSQIGEWSPSELSVAERDVRRILHAVGTQFSPSTTSCGRLFDAAGSLILRHKLSSDEGHVAAALESACDFAAPGAYSFIIGSGDDSEIDWRPAFRQMLVDRRASVPAGAMAMRFHRGLAEVVIEIARRHRPLPVVLSGGVFQNRVLVELIAAKWTASLPPLGLPGRIPPNDGGLAAGQLVATMAMEIRQESFDVLGRSRPANDMD